MGLWVLWNIDWFQIGTVLSRWLVCCWIPVRWLSHLHNYSHAIAKFCWICTSVIFNSSQFCIRWTYAISAIFRFLMCSTWQQGTWISNLVNIDVGTSTCRTRPYRRQPILIPLISTIDSPGSSFIHLDLSVRIFGCLWRLSPRSQGRSGPIVKSGFSQTTPLPLKPSDTCRLRLRARRCMGHVT